MLMIYTSPGCASCRKAKQWLKSHEIPYVEKNIFTSLLKEEEIRFLLTRSENGTDDLISKRSKIIKENNIDIDSMSTSELISFVQQNPSILKRPIIINEKSLLVGYDEEEIEIFKNRDFLKQVRCSCEKNDCPNYDICQKVRNA